MLIAIVCMLASVGGVFYAWQSTAGQPFFAYKTKFVVVAWLGVFVSLTCWIQALGAEYGAVYGIISLAFVSWLFAAKNSEFKAAQTKLKQHTQTWLAKKQLLHGAATFIVAGPIALLTSGLCSLAAIKWLPFAAANTWFFAALLFPILWALSCLWLCSADKLRGPFICLISFACLSCGILLSN